MTAVNMAGLEAMARGIVKYGAAFDTFKVSPGVAEHFGLEDGDRLQLLGQMTTVKVDCGVPYMTGYLTLEDSE